MERTRENIPAYTAQYNVSEEPVVISKHLIDLLLPEPNYSDLLGLYVFYYYTAKWQRSNQIKCTTSFVARGLKWTEARVRKVKGRLKELGLIENISTKEAGGDFLGHYIKINFIWSRQTLHESLNDFAGGAVRSRMRTTPPNALSKSIKVLFPQEVGEEDISLGYIVPSMFDRFWELYPRKVGKGPTLTLWEKMCKQKDRPKWKILKKALLKQKECSLWENPKYIVYPERWLKNKYWLNDVKEMKSWDTTPNGSEDAYEERELDPKFRTRELREEDL